MCIRDRGHAGLLRGVGACTLLGTVGSSSARENLGSGFGAIPHRDPAADAGLWALGAGREKLFIFRLVELDNKRFDHLSLTKDVILCHDLLISDKCSPQRRRHLLYAPKKEIKVFAVKFP